MSTSLIVALQMMDVQRKIRQRNIVSVDPYTSLLFILPDFIIIEIESCRVAKKFPKINKTCCLRKKLFVVSYEIFFTKPKPSPLRDVSKVLAIIKEIILIIHFRELYLT